MDLGIRDKVAVITGGSSGIGLATARLFLAEGAKIAICARNESRLHAAATSLGEEFGESHILAAPCNVLDALDVQRFEVEVRKKFGAVDMLVNNAGGGRVSTFDSTDDTAWSEELNLKIFSVVYPSRAFLDMLKTSLMGSIVNVNSLLALQPEPHMVATSAARAALLNLSRSMATEFAAFGIRVNSVLLGTVSSEQWKRRYKTDARDNESYNEYLSRLAVKKSIALGRFGEPEEAGRALVFLASPASSYTTGAYMDVSGGTARHI